MFVSKNKGGLKMNTSQSSTRLVVGLIIVAIGVLFLLSNLEIIDYIIPAMGTKISLSTSLSRII